MAETGISPMVADEHSQLLINLHRWAVSTSARQQISVSAFQPANVSLSAREPLTARPT